MGRDKKADPTRAHKTFQRQQVGPESSGMGPLLERNAAVHRGICVLRQQGSLRRGIGGLQRAA